MRDTHNMIITHAEPLATGQEETTWTLSGAVMGFAAWLMALGGPFIFYGSNTLFFFLYTWPFFLALLPVSVVIGIALHSLVNGKLLYSVVMTLITVAALFGLLFLWLLG